MKWLGCLMGLGLLAGALIESAACSPPFTTGTGGASGSSGSTSGASASSGTGGGQCPAGSCSATEYCNPETGACEVCATSMRFQFGKPMMQSVALPLTGTSALYPRVQSDTGALFLVQQDSSQHDEIARAPYAAGQSPPWGPAVVLPEIAAAYQASGPLYLPDASILAGLVSDDSITKVGTAVLLFDGDSQTAVGNTNVFAVTLAPTPAVGPVVVSLPGDAAHASSIAVAMGAPPARFWWLSDAAPGPGDAAAPSTRLVTATAMDKAPTDVLLMLDGACAAPLADTPWVTPLGDRLLFASAPCGMAGSSDTHLYQAPLSIGGKQPGDAELVLAGGDATTDTTPTLTPDQCTLLFSRVDDTGTAHIFAASRD